MFQTWFACSIGHFGTKTTHFLQKSVKLLAVNISLLNDHQPLFVPKGNCKGEFYYKSFRKMLQIEPCLHFGLWGVTELFWGKIIRFYGNITGIWGKKMHNYFIVVSILNPDKSSRDRYHRLSFLMSKTWFVYFMDHIGGKHAGFLNVNH
jgi:hypothetical protein